jgi:tRNA/tmRNA/rRNA uracil-C5-methylase (TrmA/RlmC/RlmD family)
VVSEEVGTAETVRVERPATGGGVARVADGRVVFVRHSLPGELVEVAVTESNVRFLRGDAVRVLEPSVERVKAPCPYAHPGGCGGCDLQHASLTAQHEWKAALVAEHLHRIAGVDRAVTIETPKGDVKGSRTRLRCGVDEDGRLGLRASRSHGLVDINECWIADPRLTPAFSRDWHGAREVELRAIGDGPPFAVVSVEDDRGARKEVRSFSGETLDPATHSRVDVGGVVYRVDSQSFWQSHRDAPRVLLDAVLNMTAAASGDDIVDLFSGVGLFAVALARIVGPSGRVTAVESSPYAVRDARLNATGLSNLTVREWSVTPRSVNDVVREGSTVVLDPPRHGLAKGVATSLLRRAPKRLVYVSCDAATFARDLSTLLEGGYQLGQLRVFDLFPMTEHVELVALLDSSS